MRAVVAAHENDRIGPNAIIQVLEALTAEFGQASTAAFFESIGLGAHSASRPCDMVAERDVAVLQASLRERFGVDVATVISREAGRRTGDYLLAHRIPKRAQQLLRWMPAALAARILARAIARHAWTFAGSGSFHVIAGRPFVLSIRHNPMCSMIRSATPSCDYYAATFERIFQAIVHPNATVTETQCESMGAPACVFEVCW